VVTDETEAVLDESSISSALTVIPVVPVFVIFKNVAKLAVSLRYGTTTVGSSAELEAPDNRR